VGEPYCAEQCTFFLPFFFFFFLLLVGEPVALLLVLSLATFFVPSDLLVKPGRISCGTTKGSDNDVSNTSS
jgi:hypothetical protein